MVNCHDDTVIECKMCLIHIYRGGESDMYCTA
jgi:hypothetical protein